MKCVPEDEVNCVVEVQVSAITSNAERRMQAVSSPCTIEAADEAAIAWYVRLTAQAPSTEARDAFLAWHDSQASHAAAYARVIRALGVADTVLVDPITPPELFTIEPIAAASTLPFTQRARQRSKPWLRAMQWVTAACCIVLIGYSLALLRAPDYVLVETRTGERRQLRLPDGSTIHLNTATRLEFAIDQRTRAVRFESGEAFFDVAPDVTRPFVIALGDRDVRVVGTAFNIQHVNASSEVTVTEGRVALTRERRSLAAWFPPQVSQTLTAGTRATYLANTDVIVRDSINVPFVAPWREGRLVYRGEKFEQVIKDLDRYFEGSFVVTDAAAADLSVSAVVQLGSRDQVLGALAAQLPIQIKNPATGVTQFSLQHRPSQ